MAKIVVISILNYYYEKISCTLVFAIVDKCKHFVIFVDSNVENSLLNSEFNLLIEIFINIWLSCLYIKISLFY